MKYASHLLLLAFVAVSASYLIALRGKADGRNLACWLFEMRQSAGMTNLLVEDTARGRALAEVLGTHPVALMRGHGDVVVGPSVRRAVSREQHAR